MKQVEFWKMTGSGNDFIIIDNRDVKVSDDEMAYFVQQACRRRKSVGADGVIFVVDSNNYDFGWRFFNADGGEVEMCGNGSRCVSRFAFLNGIAGPKMTFDTLAGPVSSEVTGRDVKVFMPLPTGFSMDLGLTLQPGWQSVDFVNTGVPHVVIRVEDLSAHPVFRQGRAIRHDSRFAPGGTNANFVRVCGQDQLQIRTYERGVEDETLACGTGAIACALIAALRGWIGDSPVKVKTQSGEDMIVHFRRKGNSFEQVAFEGSTQLVFNGRLDSEALLP